MIRLTVLYNLPEGGDETEFLDWRLSEHQNSNAAMPGVVRTDFARITQHWPAGAMPEYRFQTQVDWPDRASFESSFYADDVQADLKKNLQRLGDHAFFVSEILAES